MTKHVTAKDKVFTCPGSECTKGKQGRTYSFKMFPRKSLVYFTAITTVNKGMNIDILRRVRNAVGRKRSQKWRINNWFLLHDNAAAHGSVLAQDFLANNNVTTLEHPPHSPVTTPADFYLFPRLKVTALL